MKPAGARRPARFVVLTASLLAACGEPNQVVTAPPAVAVLTRPASQDTAGGNEALAAGLALEVAHLLAASPDVRVRLASDPRAGREESARQVAQRTAADVVVWLEVAGRARPAVSWSGDDAAGDVLSTPFRGSTPDPAAAPRVIADAILRALPNRHTADAPRLPAWTPGPDEASYLAFLLALGRSSRGDVDAAGRVALFDALPAALDGYPPAAVETGAALLDRAGQLGGAGPHYDSADAAIRRTFDLDPAYPPSRRLLASCHAKLGRTEESVRLLREGLAGHPDFAPYHEQLGYALRYAGLFEASLASYRRAQVLDGSLETLVATQDQITKSLIYLGDYRAALDSHETTESFLKALGRTPDEKEWFYRGVIHLYARDTAAAIDAFRRGGELDSASVWSAFGRGYAGIARGDRAAVASALGDLERLEVVDGERHYRLVHLAAFLGEADRALGHLERSIRDGFFAAPYIESDPLAAPLNSHRGFPPILEAARRRHAAFASRFAEH